MRNWSRTQTRISQPKKKNLTMTLTMTQSVLGHIARRAGRPHQQHPRYTGHIGRDKSGDSVP